MPFEKSEDSWQKSLNKSLNRNLKDNYYKNVIDKRYEKLKASTFKSLSEVLERNIL